MPIYIIYYAIYLYEYSGESRGMQIKINSGIYLLHSAYTQSETNAKFKLY